MNIPAVDVSERIIGPSSDRLVIVGDGAVEIPMVGVEEAAAVEGESVVWREPDRLVEIGERMVEIALGHIRDAAPVKRRRGIRNWLIERS